MLVRSHGQEAAPAVEPIKIGALFAISGPALFLGKPEANSAGMLTEQINAAGGIHGRPVEVIIKDTKGDPQQTIALANELIQKDRVVAIIGPSRSGSSMAIIPVITQHKIPLVSCAAAETIISPADKREWVFKTAQKDSQVIEHIFLKMKAMGLSKAGIITGTTDFGKEEIGRASCRERV